MFCEKPIDLDLARARGAAAATLRRSAAAPRLQPPLRSALPGAEGPARRRRGGRRWRRLHITSHDPAPAAGGLHQGLRRPVQGHGHPRLRHGPLAAGRGAGRGVRRRPAAWSIRRSARLGDVDTARTVLRTAVGQALHDHQQPPQRLRLRPAHRGLRLGAAWSQAGNVTESTVEAWTEAGAAADPFQNFFLDRYADAYRAGDGPFRRRARRERRPRSATRRRRRPGARRGGRRVGADGGGGAGVRARARVQDRR